MTDLILSVSLPTYNHAIYLPERIPSILAAMPQNAELIIVDDGSTDNSEEIIRSFAEQDSRIIFMKNEKNLGVIKSLHKITATARGKYMSFLSADDYILPEYFSKILHFAEKYPSFAIYVSNFGYSNDVIPKSHDEIKSDFLLPNPKGPSFFGPKQTIHLFSHTAFWVPAHCSIIQRETLLQLGGFREEFKHNTDWFLFHAAALIGGVAYLPETLAVWRLDNKGYTSQTTNHDQNLFNVQISIFNYLRKSERKDLRPLFARSGVLRGVLKQRFFYFLFRPVYWDFLLFSCIRYIRNSWKKLRAKFSTSLSFSHH
ncbi:MAG: hypothetical protein COT85_07050 [Chlamydiae bacterium CG10_big_fil_rev_8_21_14_0_10_42_34]|nr:MAG: hypothetical protein COT85_07050 [Chlamydiae bacterium CG10_big_fil_rev_8_21_14_0_10_42_34]